MADEEVTEEAAAEPKRKSNLIPIIGASLFALILGSAGGAAAMNFFGGTDKPADGAAEGGAAGDAGAEGAGASPNSAAVRPKNEVIDLETFTLNLRDSAGGRKLVMKIALEGQSGIGLLVADHTAQIRDSIITLASDYTFLEVDGTNGKLRLRDEVHRNVNAILEDSGGKITRVYFTEFVVE